MEPVTRTAPDLAELPDYAFGSASLSWWAIVGFMLIEATGFVLGVGAYFYLMPFEQSWPPEPHPPPGLAFALAFVAVAVASEALNVWTKRRAQALDGPAVRRGLLGAVAFGAVLLLLRGLELTTLNVTWTENAYGSIVWALIVLHTFHLLTDVYDTAVLAVLAHRHELTGRKFADVADNAMYWHFIVWSWVLLHLVIYWVPRWH
jgi:cytochrome c oxidase subunit III